MNGHTHWISGGLPSSGPLTGHGVSPAAYPNIGTGKTMDLMMPPRLRAAPRHGGASSVFWWEHSLKPPRERPRGGGGTYHNLGVWGHQPPSLWLTPKNCDKGDFFKNPSDSSLKDEAFFCCSSDSPEHPQGSSPEKQKPASTTLYPPPERCQRCHIQYHY